MDSGKFRDPTSIKDITLSAALEYYEQKVRSISTCIPDFNFSRASSWTIYRKKVALPLAAAQHRCKG
jgi:hypothetical protein